MLVKEPFGFTEDITYRLNNEFYIKSVDCNKSNYENDTNNDFYVVDIDNLNNLIEWLLKTFPLKHIRTMYVGRMLRSVPEHLITKSKLKEFDLINSSSFNFKTCGKTVDNVIQKMWNYLVSCETNQVD